MIDVKDKDLLLYIDIPFCPQHCSWCDKPAIVPKAEQREAYAMALAKELEASASSVPDHLVSAVYVGGGIPGHMMDEPLGELLRKLPEWFVMAPDAEVTLKVHPGMVSVDTLSACRRGRVTRLSIEYVTSNIAEHEALGRFLTPQAMEVTKQVLGNKKIDLSFDVLAGLPGQTQSTLFASLDQCIFYGAVHLNLLAFRPSEQMRQEAAQHAANPRKRLPKAQELGAWMRAAAQHLAEEGFEEYLSGHFALPGKACRYYLQEAAGAQCLGFGLGAESDLDGILSGTTKDLNCYLKYADRPEKTLRYVRYK